jgi:hypothetical protein
MYQVRQGLATPTSLFASSSPSSSLPTFLEIVIFMVALAISFASYSVFTALLLDAFSDPVVKRKPTQTTVRCKYRAREPSVYPN